MPELFITKRKDNAEIRLLYSWYMKYLIGLEICVAVTTK